MVIDELWIKAFLAAISGLSAQWPPAAAVERAREIADEAVAVALADGRVQRNG